MSTVCFGTMLLVSLGLAQQETKRNGWVYKPFPNDTRISFYWESAEMVTQLKAGRICAAQDTTGSLAILNTPGKWNWVFEEIHRNSSEKLKHF